ncbi:MAG TPA: hypothetical protein VE956_16550 [Nodularia sp. (in: cyanobacteria)]|nr:hypothetical protein [Nodularia sp. (in: cyanobacteria)]
MGETTERIFSYRKNHAIFFAAALNAIAKIIVARDAGELWFKY